MSTLLRDRAATRQVCLWVSGLLALVCLAGCGSSDQRAAPASAGAAETAAAPQQASAESVSPPATPLSSTAQLAPPTAIARPSAVPLPPAPLAPANTATPVPATALPAGPTTAAAGAGAWQTYRNDQAGYSIAYPPDWMVDERSSEAGIFLTAFTPAGGGPGVTVAAQAGEPPSIELPEQPARRCERVVAGGLTGSRCFDTRSSTTSTTLAGKGRTYIIATTTERVEEQVYQQFLDSFAPSGPVPPQIGPNDRRTATPFKTLATPSPAGAALKRLPDW